MKHVLHCMAYNIVFNRHLDITGYTALFIIDINMVHHPLYNIVYNKHSFSTDDELSTLLS